MKILVLITMAILFISAILISLYLTYIGELAGVPIRLSWFAVALVFIGSAITALSESLHKKK